MSRSKKLVRNIIVIILLSFILGSWFGLSLTPLSAYEKTEKGIHYGPSRIIHIEKNKKNQVILGRYDKWISSCTLRKVLFFFWAAESVPISIENDNSKPICYTWSYYNPTIKVYGFLNDNRIDKIEVTLTNGEIITQTEFYDNLFLVTYDNDNKGDVYFKALRGYDAENNKIFESEY